MHRPPVRLSRRHFRVLPVGEGVGEVEAAGVGGACGSGAARPDDSGVIKKQESNS